MEFTGWMKKIVKVKWFFKESLAATTSIALDQLEQVWLLEAKIKKYVFGIQILENVCGVLM